MKNSIVSFQPDPTRADTLFSETTRTFFKELPEMTDRLLACDLAERVLFATEQERLPLDAEIVEAVLAGRRYANDAIDEDALADAVGRADLVAHRTLTDLELEYARHDAWPEYCEYLIKVRKRVFAVASPYPAWGAESHILALLLHINAHILRQHDRWLLGRMAELGWKP